MPPLLPTSQNGPSGLGRAETFWNSFSCDPSIAMLQSVPAFLLSQASVGPRSSGEVARQHVSARSNQRSVNSSLCLNLFFAERQSYMHSCGFNDRAPQPTASEVPLWPVGLIMKLGRIRLDQVNLSAVEICATSNVPQGSAHSHSSEVPSIREVLVERGIRHKPLIGR